MKDIMLLGWLLYLTIFTVISWFTAVDDFADFIMSLLVYMFLFAISVAIAK